MFGRDEYNPLVQLLNPKIRYMGDNQRHLPLDTQGDTWDTKYDSSNRAVAVWGKQLEMMDESWTAHKVNVQDVNPVYTIDELLRCLVDATVFGYFTKCVTS